MWKASADGRVPNKAFRAGYDENRDPIYVVKARVNNVTLPGKLLPSDNCGYVSLDNVEHAVRQYEVCKIF